MAVVGSARELVMEGKRKFKTSLENGDEGVRTFQVTCDSDSDTEATVLAATGIPAALDLFPGSLTAELISKEPTRPYKSHRMWDVICTYSSRTSQEQRERAAHPDPLDRATIVSAHSRTVMKPVRRCLRTPAYQLWDEAGPGAGFTMRTAANSASDPLDPPVTVACVEWVYHFSKNVDELPSWAISDDYQNGVNDADQTFSYNGFTKTFTKGCGKLSDIKSSTPRRENGVDYLVLEWDVIVLKPRELFGSETTAPGPWDEERLDEGMRTRATVGDETIWKNVRDSTNQSIMLPVPFNGAGSPITTTGAAIPESDLFYYCYRPYGARVDFSILPWS